MPRGRLGITARRAASEAMRFEQLCQKTRQNRQAMRKAQRHEDICRKTYGWLELRDQMEGLEIQAEMKAMELRLLNADRQLIGLPPVEALPSNGGMGDMRRPEDDWRNYE